ncbi:DgyrCDS9256 [Dimorphilus gyrociliatus]|uniref:DgyrCDS9256 n=1 Tax=Dimorphilus gyrociliatus TaxID=2664684 RepID=A0A7I8W1P1_9ANNE|nr:DgyrCDS9256 [Dimorphilus gyrociliatus]
MSRLPRSRKPVLQLEKVIVDNNGEDNGNSEIDYSYKEEPSIKDDPLSKEMENFMAEINAMSNDSTDVKEVDELNNGKGDIVEPEEPIESPPAPPPTPPPPPPPLPLSKPQTKWETVLDENTNCYYYHDTSTGAVTWEVPEEYERYLLQVDEYNKIMALKNESKGEEISRESENELIVRKREDRKRKSKGSVGLCLIPYDESASEDEDEDRRKERAAKVRCTDPELALNDEFDVDNALESAVDQKFDFRSKQLSNYDRSTQTPPGCHCNAPQADLIKQKPIDENKIKEEVIDQLDTFLRKFEFFSIQKTSEPFVKFLTRKEDWENGQLSSRYLLEKLEETNEILLKYEKSEAPPGWLFKWDK